jgi:hypothetical protein
MRQGQRTRPEVVATALALREQGLSLPEVARIVGCSDVTVLRYERQEVRVAREAMQTGLVEGVKGALAKEFARVGLDALAGLEAKDWEKASPVQRVTGAAIAADKIVALSGGGGVGGGGGAGVIARLATTAEGREMLASLSTQLAEMMRLAERGPATALPEAVVDIAPGDVREV